MDNVRAVIRRIDEIKTRFGLKKQDDSQKGESFQKTFDSIENNVATETKIKDTNEITVPKIKEIANDYAMMNRVPASLVNAVIKTESGFNPNAVSKKGAKGLMQLMPTTIKDLGVSNPFNIHENIMGGVSHLKRLLEKYNWDYKKALAAYNAGETAVDKNGGIPPYKETIQYVKKVIDAYKENAR